MQSFWITFEDGSGGCCDGVNAFDAKQIAEHFTGKKVKGGEYRDFSAEPLPYPASPAIWRFEHPIHGKCPPFCHQPQQCKGLSSCPSNRACSD